MTEFLQRTLKELPYFRATLRAVEASYYQTLKMDSPVLDIGCGDGQFASLAFRQKLDVGIDPWRKPLKEALQVKSYHLLIQGEGDRLPFNDGFLNALSAILSSSILQMSKMSSRIFLASFKLDRIFIFVFPTKATYRSFHFQKYWGKDIRVGLKK
jgi:hypothetical protein